MKKWLFALLAGSIIAFIFIYIFIPTDIRVSKVTLIHFTSIGSNRFLMDKAGWSKWWPGTLTMKTNAGNDSALVYNETTFNLSQQFYNAADIGIYDQGRRYSSRLTIIPILKDSVAVQWETSLKAGWNPLERLKEYIHAHQLKNQMTQILNSAKSFLEDPEKVYGYSIHHTTLKDTSVISTKYFSKEYPSTDQIYSMISILRDYIALNKAKETDFPMLNITKKDSSGYDVMVGIPTDHDLQSSGAIFPKHLVPIPDKMLSAEVKGGPYTIKKAFEEVETYMTDHQLTSPVIPFYYLVTDRSKEKDTTRWITKIYYPII